MPQRSADHPTHSHKHDGYWEKVLTGDMKMVKGVKGFLQGLPAPPRCKICHAPFQGPYTPFLRLVGLRRWQLNQQICRICIGTLGRYRGGAEVPVSLLFTDVRGSTTLAEQMTPSEFTASLNQFFEVVFDAVDSEAGLIDHIVGDGVMAMWTIGFSGNEHAERTVASGRKLASNLANHADLGDDFPAGVGVHTGVAYVGVVGEVGALDFTVVGDAANTTARLGSAALGGELVMSDEIVAAASVDTTHLERRSLELKGKSGTFPAWVEKVPAGQA